MSRSPCPPTLYVVAWDEQNIVKAGYTARRRWRDWELRGARVVLLLEFAHFEPALAAESAALAALHEIGRLAFGSETESRVLLGRCGGWRETFRVDALDDALALLVRIGSEHAVPHASPHCGDALPPSIATEHCHERTNERDGRTSLSPWEPSLREVTRASAYTPGSLADLHGCRRHPSVVRSA